MDSKLNQPKQYETFTDWLRAVGAPILNPIVEVLARLGFSPNVITVVAMLGHFISAGLLALGYVSYAGISLCIIAPLDAFDGALARRLGVVQNGFGAFLDSTFDRLAEIILFAGFIYYYDQLGNTPLMFVSYAALTGSIMVSYARGRAEALGFECKIGLFGRVERYLILMPLLSFGLADITVVILAIGTYITVIQRITHVWRQAQELAQNEQA